MGYIGQTASDTPKEFPLEARKLNWGAFWLYWLWGPFNGYWPALWVGLASFVIPFLGLVAHGYFLFKGNEIAWDVQDWPSVEAFNERQRLWAVVTTLVIMLPALLGISAAIVIPFMLQGRS